MGERLSPSVAGAATGNGRGAGGVSHQRMIAAMYRVAHDHAAKAVELLEESNREHAKGVIAFEKAQRMEAEDAKP